MADNMRIICQCGAIDFRAGQPQPLEVYFCHCLECRKQSSSAFGISAIFSTNGTWPPSAETMSSLRVWTRPSKTGGTMQCYFCNTCGARIAHVVLLPDGTVKPTVSIKGGAVEGLSVKGAKHIWTKTAIVDVPQGSDRASPEP